MLDHLRDTHVSKRAPRSGCARSCRGSRIPSSQQARPVSWKYSLGIFTSRLRCLTLNAGRRKVMKLASRMLNQGPGGRLGDAAVVSQGGVVEQLPGAAGAELHEALERGEVPDIGDRAHIPLDVGGDVGTEPVRRIEAAIENRRIAAAEQRSIEAGGMLGEAPDLVPGQGQELVHGRASRSDWPIDSSSAKFCDPLRIQRPGRRVGVDDALQVRKQLGCALHLVEDRAPRELRQEAPRVLRREGAHVRRLERAIRMSRKHHAAQRGLAALPRPGERDGRRPGRRSRQLRLQVAMDPREAT